MLVIEDPFPHDRHADAGEHAGQIPDGPGKPPMDLKSWFSSMGRQEGGELTGSARAMSEYQMVMRRALWNESSSCHKVRKLSKPSTPA